MDPTSFRSAFPEFGNPSLYPDSMVTAWITVATSLVNADRWMELTDLGIQLVTAHHLALSARDQNAAAVGGVPGLMTGPTASKSVDKVSTSYDTGAASLDGAGFWALTSYGTRYLSLARMMGAGGLQIN
jgi:hypothetical protein